MYSSNVYNSRCLYSIFCLMLMVGVNGQNEKNCQLTDSKTLPGYQDAYCRCGESLSEDAGDIDSFTINRAGCVPYLALNISWMDIEAGMKFRSISFVGSEIVLMSPVTEKWQSMVRKIEFVDCIFDYIPGRAFEGLVQLEELRFINNYIGSVHSYAISNLQNLLTLEISDSYMVDIEQFAISGLPNLLELAFVRCEITTIMSDAVHNLRTPDLPSETDCPEIDIRFSGNRDGRLMGDVLERSLKSTENLPLPEFGPRLLFYRNNISVIENSAIESNSFAFIIFAGTHIVNLGEKALNVELSNQCEISALMVVQNVIDNIGSDSFASVQSRLQATHKTYFVMTNNTFSSVSENAFRFHPTLEVFSVADNKFSCECINFRWHYYSSMAPTSMSTIRQHEIEGKLTSSGKCQGQDANVDSFLSTCTKDDYSTGRPQVSVTQSTPFPVTTPIQLQTEYPKLSGAEASSQKVSLFIVSLLLLITL